tara:strand:+ start:2578 stop:3114 length:537 start_codon:yes stop_codon:yes gene_type:complete
MNDEIIDTTDEDLDIKWIEEFQAEEENYSMFYPDHIEELTVSILYVNKNKQIEKVSEKKITLGGKNEIHRNELVTLIKQNEKIDKRKYKLLSILVYNFSLDGDELKNFLKDSGKYDFMTNLKQIDSYCLESTINCMHDINNLFMVFYEENSDDITNKSNRQTKRVRFNLMNGKTRRKK